MEGAISDIRSSGDYAAGGLARIEPLELLDGFRRHKPRRDRLFLPGHEKSKIDRGIHGLVLLQRPSYNH